MRNRRPSYLLAHSANTAFLVLYMRNETYAVRGEEELQVDKPVDIGKRRPDDI